MLWDGIYVDAKTGIVIIERNVIALIYVDIFMATCCPISFSIPRGVEKLST